MRVVATKQFEEIKIAYRAAAGDGAKRPTCFNRAGLGIALPHAANRGG